MSGAEVPPDPRERNRIYDRARRRRRMNLRKHVRHAKTFDLRRESKETRAVRRLELVEDRTDHELPVNRGDCRGTSRPCPMVSCRYSLYLDVSSKTGALKHNFPDLLPEDMPADASCALDVADAGEATLERVGDVLNITRERIRQVANLAWSRFAAHAGPRRMAEMRGILLDAYNRPPSPFDTLAEDATAIGGGRRESGESGKVPDAYGLTREERAEIDAWVEDVAGLYLEGVPLRRAQALVNGRNPGSVPEE